MANKFVIIKLDNAGKDQGPLFDIYHTSVTASNLVYGTVERARIETGITASVPVEASTYIVKSLGVCETENVFFANLPPEDQPNQLPPEQDDNCACTSSFTDCSNFTLRNRGTQTINYSYQSCNDANFVTGSVPVGTSLNSSTLLPVTYTPTNASGIELEYQENRDSLYNDADAPYCYTAIKCGTSDQQIVIRSNVEVQKGQVVTLNNNPCCYQILEQIDLRPGYLLFATVGQTRVFDNCDDCCGDEESGAEIPTRFALEVSYDRTSPDNLVNKFEALDRIFIYSEYPSLQATFDAGGSLYANSTKNQLAERGWYYDANEIRGRLYNYYFNTQSVVGVRGLIGQIISIQPVNDQNLV